jgi:ABC-2 type transport system ATP-binding protein
LTFYTVELLYDVEQFYVVEENGMLEIRELAKAYGDRGVLLGVDLDVGAGEIVGLLGANGAGKTTLISIVAGLRRADRGSVRVAGREAMRHRAQSARLIGLAPQELGIYPTLTVRQNLMFFARLAGLGPSAARRRIDSTAEALGLADRLNHRAEVLSGGQKRRLHTAMAVLHQPKLVFLDEPTVGADVASRAGILDVVRQLAADGTAVLYTTHYLTELEQLGAAIAVLHAGRIAVRAPLPEVIARFAAARVALRFAGDVPHLPGWRVDGPRLVPEAAVTDPVAAAARALAALGAHAGDLAGVEIARPSLESAYLAITGEPADAAAETAEDGYVLAA